jgi:hypothetical protein
MPVLRDLNSQSRRTGISFAKNDNLPEKKPSAYFLVIPATRGERSRTKAGIQVISTSMEKPARKA